MDSGHARPVIQSLAHLPAWSTILHTGDEELRSDVLKILDHDFPWHSIDKIPEILVLPVIDVLQKVRYMQLSMMGRELNRERGVGWIGSFKTIGMS